MLLLGFCFKTHWDIVNASGWGTARSILQVQSFNLSREDAHDKDEYRYLKGV